VQPVLMITKHNSMAGDELMRIMLLGNVFNLFESSMQILK